MNNIKEGRTYKFNLLLIMIYQVYGYNKKLYTDQEQHLTMAPPAGISIINSTKTLGLGRIIALYCTAGIKLHM